jgi:hypothetical protein
MQFFKLIADFVTGLLGGGLGKLAIKALSQAHKDRLNAQNEQQRIAADLAVEFWEGQVTLLTKAAKEGTERQKWKMNHKVFWFILSLAVGPGLGTYLLLSVYNVLWWEHGIWPQPWSIAAFPPPYDIYLRMSMEWIFDPVKLGTSATVATIAGYVTGGRK